MNTEQVLFRGQGFKCDAGSGAKWTKSLLSCHRSSDSNCWLIRKWLVLVLDPQWCLVSLGLHRAHRAHGSWRKKFPEVSDAQPSSAAHHSFEKALVHPSCKQLKLMPWRGAQHLSEVWAASLGCAAELLAVADPTGSAGTSVLPVTAAPALGHQAPVRVVPVGWGSEVTPACTWKYLESKVDSVVEAFVLLVHRHHHLVVEGNSTAQLLWAFFSCVWSLVQHGFSTNIPKSVPWTSQELPLLNCSR